MSTELTHEAETYAADLFTVDFRRHVECPRYIDENNLQGVVDISRVDPDYI